MLSNDELWDECRKVVSESLRIAKEVHEAQSGAYDFNFEDVLFIADMLLETYSNFMLITFEEEDD
jgi:hypothetical protein